ncbi:hypothetical protein ACFCYI_12965 [Streptomyces sp. NPDC056257]|uniref:hypothetical protein n=1 Tax=Streptomyces sp. NPDC056257 TaxID=3345765 RepID=UPI0035E12EF2
MGDNELFADIIGKLDQDDWGAVDATAAPVQARAWMVRVRKLGPVVDATMFESGFPAGPHAPERAGGTGSVDLATGGVAIGRGDSLSSRALGNALPDARDGRRPDVPTPGAAYAQTGAATLEVAIPYAADSADGTQPSKVCVHLAALTASALSQPGKAIQFSGTAGGHLSIMGAKEIDIPAMWPANFPFRLPADTSKPALAIGFLNEQITTDSQGQPTRGKNGAYAYDPKATSGFTNAVRLIVFGDETTEVTIGHAAVIRAQ